MRHRKCNILIIYIAVLGSSFLWIAGAESQDRPDLVVQSGHTGLVGSLAFSPDGRYLVSGSWDRTVKVWEIDTGREIRAFTRHNGLVKTVAFSPNGRYVASGGQDKIIRLWDTTTGREVRTFKGHINDIQSVAFSHDGGFLVSTSSGTYRQDAPKDMTVRLWDTATGNEVRTFTGHTQSARSAYFARDDRWVVSASFDGTVRVWEVSSGAVIRTINAHDALKPGHGVSALAVSPDGSLAASAGADRMIKLWDLASGKNVKILRGHKAPVVAMDFSPDGRVLMAGSQHIRKPEGLDETLTLWDVRRGRKIRTIKGNSGGIGAAAFSPDGKFLAATNGISPAGIPPGRIRLWNVKTGRELEALAGYSDKVYAAAYSPDGYRVVAAVGMLLRVWDLETGQQVATLKGHQSPVTAVAFSPDGRFLLSGSGRKGDKISTLKLWNPSTGRLIRTFEGGGGNITSISFSPDGRLALSTSWKPAVQLWDSSTGKLLRTFRDAEDRFVVQGAAFSPDQNMIASVRFSGIRLWNHSTGALVGRFGNKQGGYTTVAFTGDGKHILTGSLRDGVKLWNIETKKARTLKAKGGRGAIYTLALSPGGRQILTGHQDKTVRLWDLDDAQEVHVLRGHTGLVSSVSFSSDGQFALSGSEDGTLRWWDLRSDREIARAVSFADDTWAVVDTDGRFDAANAGDIEGLHWVVGLEPIALAQLKDRYYDPGLLAKKLGQHDEPVLNVAAFRLPKLPPSVDVEPPAPGDDRLRIKLNSRGGGIGRVVVFVNGKEVAADARGSRADPDAKSMVLTVPLAAHPLLIPGRDNEIEVRAFNAEGYLSTRGVRVTYRSPGEALTERPQFWAIVAGVSDYAGEHIDLRYAAKDAQDIASAVGLGATRLFGADNVHLSVLATGRGSEFNPTKQRLEEAFAELRGSKPWDVVMVYLAGHGVAVGDTYHYLTAEARSTELTDPEIRKLHSLSSEEMVGWLKEAPALKQVMVLDTCAAGTAAKRLVEKRSISSSQIRAIERLKDRTGFHVLMGSAVDAVSYEATQYQQGLVTYALLNGMRGAALREGEYVDVSQLFQHAADEVPKLAGHIGGIQRPQIAAPRGTSFDIGQLKTKDQQAIPLALSKPMILRPVLQNAEELYDNLELEVKVRRQLREQSYAALRDGARRLPAVYVDADQLAGAIRPRGNYRVQGDTVEAELVLVKDGKKLTRFQVKGSSGDLEGFTQSIVEAILQVVSDTQ